MAIKISGFTFIKDGLTLGYPIKESIQSISELCDEIVINVGFDNTELINDDGTYQYLRDHFNSKKFIFLKSYWDPKFKKNGQILSHQTNIALKKCTGKYCQYIQGDEVLHENDLTLIENSIKDLELNSLIQGIVYNFIHFYGNTDIYKYTRNIYRREVRLIRNHQNIISWKDAQGFRGNGDNKISCKLGQQKIYHYGWARQEKIMNNKIMQMHKLYHNDEKKDIFEYEKIWGMKKFKQTHPKFMKEWIKANHNEINFAKLPFRFNFDVLGLAVSDFIEEITNYRIGEYKNYRLI